MMKVLISKCKVRTEIALLFSTVLLLVILKLTTSKLSVKVVILSLALITLGISVFVVRTAITANFKRRKDDEERRNKLRTLIGYRDECYEKIQNIEELYILLKMSIDTDKNDTLKKLYISILECNTISDFEEALKELSNVSFTLFKKLTEQDVKYDAEQNKTANHIIEYLRILNINYEPSDFSVVKNAYLSMVKCYHPDKHNGSTEYTEKTQEINSAYKELKEHYCT